MKKCFIFSNQKFEESGFLVKRIDKILSSQNIDLEIHDVFSGFDCQSTDNDAIAIVLGGDGTILKAAHSLSDCNVPIMGINLGNVGYLASYEPENLNIAMDDLINNNYTIEKRAVLQATITDSTNKTATTIAYNDIVIHRSAFNGTIPFEAYINEAFIDSFKADGLIVSTATGSTAYNFSAGGPILNPLSRNYIFNPICAHSMFSHSIVLMDTDKLKILVDYSNDKYNDLHPTLSSDGQDPIILTSRFEINVSLSDKYLNLIKPKGNNFYEILRKKIH